MCWAGVGRHPLVCIGINPSTAQPGALDPTLKSVERLANANGFDSWIMFNVYPQRATDPNDMDKTPDRALCDENLRWLQAVLAQTEPTMVGGMGHPDRKAGLPARSDAGDGGPDKRAGHPVGHLWQAEQKRATPITRSTCAKIPHPSRLMLKTIWTPVFEGGIP